MQLESQFVFWCAVNGTGHDFDMTEYEMLNLEQYAPIEPPGPLTPTPAPSQPTLPQPEPTTPLLSAPESFQDKSTSQPVASEEPEEEEEFASSASVQFRFKRRAPEVPLFSDG